MLTYGDGSDGALNVTSGTYGLSLDHKYQFGSVNISSGATLTTDSASGSVLYILCSGVCTINGIIDVSNKVAYGNNTWSVSIDGTTYSTPGVAAGSNGTDASASGGFGGISANGFGGGGGGGEAITVTAISGGDGGNGSSTFGPSPSPVSLTRTTQGYGSVQGLNGQGSAGGGGGAIAGWTRTSGDVTASVTATGGAGGSSYGANGGDGTGSYATTGGSGGYTYGWDGGGGGGAGGRAGRSGVHVVIKAPVIIFNGTIITSGTNGQNGGNGGRRIVPSGIFSWGGAGGGAGGGGRSGNIYLVYDSLFNSGTTTKNGGTGGSGGITYNDGVAAMTAPSGTNGSNGSLILKRVVPATGLASGGGLATFESEYGAMDILSSASGGGRGAVSTVFQALPQKDYEYRVFDHEGNFIGVWKNVASQFEYTQSINENASELNVRLARSPDNRIVKIDVLLDHTGAQILDPNSDPILLQTTTSNAVGEDTDVDLNYNVDVYAFYGGYEAIKDEFGNDILDETGSVILSQYGAPNGKRVYSGYIADYELVYGETTGVDVVIVPHATEMNHFVFMDSSGNTTVEYNSADPVQMARDGMDNYNDQGGIITYTTATMPLSGQVSSYDFTLQTTREVEDKAVELLPAGYYHFVHPGENLQYLLPKSLTADHTFWNEKHLKELRLKKSITQLINKAYFIGGDTGTGKLYKYYEDATSISDIRPGLTRLSDSRVTQSTSAQALSQKEINEFKSPRFRASITITDAVYDIESIRLGQMVSFKNYGNLVDTLLLQIVSNKRARHEVTLDLDMVVPGDAKRLEEIKRNILSEEVRELSDAPS